MSMIPGSELVIPRNAPPLRKGGAGGDVFRGRAFGEEVAIRLLNSTLDNPTGWELLQKEVEMLMILKHENIVTFKGVCLNPASIVTEFCPKGSLFELLRTREFAGGAAAAASAAAGSGSSGSACTGSWLLGGRRSRRDVLQNWDVRLQLVIGVARGMMFLHSREEAIVHGELGSKTIVLKRDSTPMIMDVGLEMWRNSTNQDQNQDQDDLDLRWLAPEVALRHEAATAASDVYSFAIILWEVLTGKPPWTGPDIPNTGPAVLEQLRHQNRPPVPEELPEDWPGVQDFVLLMQSCWSEDLNTRPIFSDIVRKLEGIREMTRDAIFDEIQRRRSRTSPNVQPSIKQRIVQFVKQGITQSFLQIQKLRSFGAKGSAEYDEYDPGPIPYTHPAPSPFANAMPAAEEDDNQVDPNDPDQGGQSDRDDLGDPGAGSSRFEFVTREEAARRGADGVGSIKVLSNDLPEPPSLQIIRAFVVDRVKTDPSITDSSCPQWPNIISAVEPWDETGETVTQAQWDRLLELFSGGGDGGGGGAAAATAEFRRHPHWETLRDLLVVDRVPVLREPAAAAPAVGGASVPVI